MERLGAPLALLAIISWGCTATEESSSSEEAWPLVYSQDFEAPTSLAGYEFTRPESWTWTDSDGVGSLELLGKSDYEPPHRSPHSIALIPAITVADFDLEVELLQTGHNYDHRDMCLFFGFQSPARYYYVHLATSPDENAHNVFKVHDAPRTNLAEVASEGIDWGENTWHRVRLERRVEPGTVRVFWDDGAEPVLDHE